MILAASDTAGLLDVNGTFIAELIAFLVMVWILWRYAYPRIIQAAEARQKAIASALEEAERARAEAELRLKDAERRLADARTQAQEVIDAAARSAEQIRQQLRDRGEEEAKRLLERAQADIEAARQKAVDSLRGEVADLVVLATERVIGESLDGDRHRKLIEKAIEEVAGGQRSR